jgi:hypothetical protein
MLTNANKKCRKSAVFYCKNCDYTTKQNSHYQKHLKSIKHNLSKDANTMLTKVPKSADFYCDCGKSYLHKSSLSRHRKKCEYVNSSIIEKNDEDESLKSMFLHLVKENKELKNMIIEQDKKQDHVMEEVKRHKNQIINNNQFNLNIFLNEECKDALNMDDFIKQLKVGLNELDFTKDNGINQGITNLFLNGLNELGTYKRPIHCSDMKREVLYVKNNDIWDKDDSYKSIENGVKNIKNQYIIEVKNWETLNKENMETEEFKDEYTKLITNLMEEIRFNKIKKELSKSVLINKN